LVESTIFNETSHLCGKLQGHAVLLHGLSEGVGMGLAMIYGG